MNKWNAKGSDVSVASSFYEIKYYLYSARKAFEYMLKQLYNYKWIVTCLDFSKSILVSISLSFWYIFQCHLYLSIIIQSPIHMNWAGMCGQQHYVPIANDNNQLGARIEVFVLGCSYQYDNRFSLCDSIGIIFDFSSVPAL